MQGVKDRLQAAFLAPLRNPELQKLYGKSLRGGLLLYGPPGCGKTFLARALAGELGASFVSAGLAEILDMWLGSSERNLHELFASVRRNAPCVLFLDEIDALGHKRSQAAAGAMRGTVNQLLTELDGVTADNDGVFVLAATNQPWDVDPALRRPGRLDRTLLVLPPDAAAREAIFRYHLAHRPVEGIDLSALAGASAGFSGADIAFVCEQATEHALLDGARTGTARLIGMADLTAALQHTRPSTGPWLQTARTVVQYGQDDGTFAELKQYLKNAKRW
nr:ATP-binding protein [Nakamurella aerolata]